MSFHKRFKNEMAVKKEYPVKVTKLPLNHTKTALELQFHTAHFAEISH